MEIPSQRMQASINQGEHLIYLTIYPVGYNPDRSYPLVVMLHGMGASMYDLASLASIIDSEGYIFLCPNAPVPVQLDQGALGFAWSVPGSEDPRDIERSEAKFEGCLQEVMAENRIAEGKTIMFGFSQGGSMTYRYGLSHPEIFAGLVALGTSIRDPEAMRERLPAERNQSIFVGHGLQDNVERARSSKEFLEAEGYTPYYREYEMGHEINQDVMIDVVPWIHSVSPPLRPNEGPSGLILP